MEVELELGRGWRLAGDVREPAVGLAAAELEAALGPPGGDGVELALSHGKGVDEAFRRRATQQRIELRGDSPHALLFGTYAMLEEFGARWQWPGQRDAPSPSHARAPLRLVDEVEGAPALPGRCLVLGERALVESAEDWIVWAAQHRLNGVFIHVSTRSKPVGAAPEAVWRGCREHAVALARERGMTIEHGGHLLPELLHGDDVRALAQGRKPSRAARLTLEEHVRTHPEADVVHLWGADLPAGGGREASAAALRTANAVAELADGVRPGAQVGFLAYHDTEEVPLGVPPHDNVCLVFAPRERCYDHALADPACRSNTGHRERLLAQLQHFRDAGAAPPRVFEYWFDALRLGLAVPDLTGTIAQDLAFYRSAGVHTVQMLMTGHGRSPSPHPNPVAFARFAWDPPGFQRADRGR